MGLTCGLLIPRSAPSLGSFAGVFQGVCGFGFCCLCELRLSGVYHCGISTYTFLETFWQEPPRVGVDLGIANPGKIGLPVYSRK